MPHDWDDSDEPVADALMSVARALRDLGNGDAATPMGGLEALGAVLLEATDKIVSAIATHADAVDTLACAVRSLKEGRYP